MVFRGAIFFKKLFNIKTNKMKKVILPVLFVFLSATLVAQNVGIGTTTPDASALLHVNSTVKGLLIPRMTTAQKNALVAPANGLIVFQTDSITGMYYNAGTTVLPIWERMVTSVSTNAWQLGGNAGTVPGTHFIGTTDGQALTFKINNYYLTFKILYGLIFIKSGTYITFLWRGFLNL